MRADQVVVGEWVYVWQGHLGAWCRARVEKLEPSFGGLQVQVGFYQEHVLVGQATVGSDLVLTPQGLGRAKKKRMTNDPVRVVTWQQPK